METKWQKCHECKANIKRVIIGRATYCATPRCDDCREKSYVKVDWDRMKYDNYIQDICNTDYQYQGEEGLHRAYEDFPFEEWLKEQNETK